MYNHDEVKNMSITLTYTSKQCTLIEVLSVPNAYTTSEQTIILGDFTVF